MASSVGKSIYSPAQRRLTALLRHLREEAGLRQVDLAEQLERPQSYVSKYESGQRRLDLIELGAVCETLGVTLGDFVRLYEESG